MVCFVSHKCIHRSIDWQPSYQSVKSVINQAYIVQAIHWHQKVEFWTVRTTTGLLQCYHWREKESKSNTNNAKSKPFKQALVVWKGTQQTLVFKVGGPWIKMLLRNPNWDLLAYLSPLSIFHTFHPSTQAVSARWVKDRGATSSIFQRKSLGQIN